MKNWLVLACFLVLGFARAEAQFAENQENIPAEVVRFETRFEPKDPRPGEYLRALIVAKIHPEWHLYALLPVEEPFAPQPTKIQLNAVPLKSLGPAYESNPITAKDPVLGMTLHYHKDQAIFYQNWHRSDSEPLPPHIQGTIRYQVCSDRICLPPKTENLEWILQTGEGPVRPEYAHAQYSVDSLPQAGSLEALNQQGFWAFLGLAAISGALALLTPCVFPMIPITIGFFVKHHQASAAQVIRLSLMFAAGMVGTYTVLGLGLSALLGATGVVSLASNGWVNFAIGSLFIFFGLSLMGFFQLSLGGLENQVDRWARQVGGFGGVFLMGLAFTLTAFTCTVQFVGTLLIAAAQGHWLWPVLGMLTFATVFALPFILLGLFPRWIHSMKSLSGDWLQQAKIVLGLLELAAAFKFFSNADLVWGGGVFDREMILTLWALIGGLVAAFLLGMVAIHEVRVQKNGLGGFSLALIFLFFSAYLAQGISGKARHGLIEAYLPPRLSGASSALEPSTQTSASLVWQTNLQEALALATQEKKRVFIDFTGYTCVNCRWMEKNIFAETPVIEAFQRDFILVQLYTDGGPDQEANQRLQVGRFQTLALPFYVILNHQDQVLARHSGIMATLPEFLNFLSNSGDAG